MRRSPAPPMQEVVGEVSFPRMAVFQHPPWVPDPDEAQPASLEDFSLCQRVVDAIVSRLNGRIATLSRSIGAPWGAIVRATVAYDDAGAPGSYTLICWWNASKGVQMALLMDDCCQNCAGPGCA